MKEENEMDKVMDGIHSEVQTLLDLIRLIEKKLTETNEPRNDEEIEC
jgi:hypothetical protein